MIRGNIRLNAIANFFGRVAVAGAALLELPVYLAHLGPAAAGVIAFNATIYASLSIFESGFTALLNYAVPERAITAGLHKFSVLSRTLEIISWTIAAIFLGGAFVLGEVVKSDELAATHIAFLPVAALMALSTGFAFIGAVYCGILRATEDQVVSNSLSSGLILFRAIFAVAAVILFHAGVLVVLGVYSLFALIYSGVARVVAFRRAGVDLTQLNRIEMKAAIGPHLKFLLHMLYVKFTGVLSSQGDRVVASMSFSLETFGYYAIAMTLASRLNVLATPVQMAVWPRFAAQFREGGETPAAKTFYHKSMQASLLVMLPAAIVIISMPHQVLFGWTGNHQLAMTMALPLSLLATGSLASGLYQIPYAAQISTGWGSLTSTLTTSLAPLAIVLMFLLASRFGPIALGSIVAVRDLVFLIVGSFWMHQKLLKGEERKFFLNDIGVTVVIALLSPIVFLSLFRGPATQLHSLVMVVCAALLSSIFLLARFPWTRDSLTQIAKRTWASMPGHNGSL